MVLSRLICFWKRYYQRDIDKESMAVACHSLFNSLDIITQVHTTLYLSVLVRSTSNSYWPSSHFHFNNTRCEITISSKFPQSLLWKDAFFGGSMQQFRSQPLAGNAGMPITI